MLFISGYKQKVIFVFPEKIELFFKIKIEHGSKLAFFYNTIKFEA